MKNSTKRILVAALALMITASATACGGGSKTGSDKNEGNNEAESYSFEVYRNGAWPTFPADGGDGVQIMKDAQKAYGLPDINVHVTTIGGTEYYDKLNVLAVSSSLPDYMNINQLNMTNFADQDLIIPVEEYIKDLPAIKDKIRETDVNAIQYNGHQYALTVGYLGGAINGPNTDGLIVRKDWLDKVGLDVPTTIDEFHDMLKAFKEKDPDGNGANDTFGYIGQKTTLFQDVFGAYGIQPTFWMKTDDGLRFGSTLPGTKEALKTLQQWYSEGLIDPDIFTNDTSLQDQKLANSKGGVYEGSGFTCDPNNPETSALLSVTPTAEMVGIPAIKGPNGDSGRQESSPGYGNLYAISKSCKNPDVLLKLLNWCADDGENGGMYLCSVGVEGKDFELNEEKTKITLKSTYDDIYAEGLGNPVRFLQVVDRRWMVDSAVKCFNDFDGMYRINNFWGTTPTMISYPDTTQKLFQQYLAKIVMGTDSVDSWDDYVKEFYAMGGTEIEKEVNEAYAASNK